MPPRASLTELYANPRLFWQTVIIWGSSTAVYGYYLWGPTIVALVLSVPVGQAANGVGKILGPLALALIVGSSNLVSPQATDDAVLPAFLFLSVNMLLVALGFAFLGVETHGRPMALGDGGAGVSHGRSPRRSLGQVRALISTVNEAYPPKIQRGRG